MKMADALTGVSKIFLDTAPVIYYIEGTLRYQPLTDVIFQKIQGGSLEAVTATITLAECCFSDCRSNISKMRGFSDKRYDAQTS